MHEKKEVSSAHLAEQLKLLSFIVVGVPGWVEFGRWVVGGWLDACALSKAI